MSEHSRFPSGILPHMLLFTVPSPLLALGALAFVGERRHGYSNRAAGEDLLQRIQPGLGGLFFREEAANIQQGASAVWTLHHPSTVGAHQNPAEGCRVASGRRLFDLTLPFHTRVFSSLSCSPTVQQRVRLSRSAAPPAPHEVYGLSESRRAAMSAAFLCSLRLSPYLPDTGGGVARERSRRWYPESPAGAGKSRDQSGVCSACQRLQETQDTLMDGASLPLCLQGRPGKCVSRVALAFFPRSAPRSQRWGG